MKKDLIGKKIVTIGGGTGGFTVNKGLHGYPVSPTAICTVFDSGGSTGALRDEFGSLPQGDIRRCLIALADDKDDTLREMFAYRFQNGTTPTSLSDHSLGNLLLLAAEKIWGPIEGIRRISKVLGLAGQVLPVSIDNSHIWAELSDGTKIKGETNIDLRPLEDERLVTKIWLEPEANICREAAEAIMQADVIVLGPGDLYTSIIPNLLVNGVADAISRSKAKLVFVANLMTKWSETRDFTIPDFLKTFLAYGIGREQFDTVLINTTPIPAALLPLYAQKDKSYPIVYDTAMESEIKTYTKEIIVGDYLNRSGLTQKLVRHDPIKLAKTIITL
jgi:uncharacterized cofD-like protein